MKTTFSFNPATLPFFYGWVILGCGTIGILLSIPGQTVGVSAFTDSLITELQISRSLLSFTYLIGTVASALLLTYVGILYDRFGARKLAPGAALLLGLMLSGMTLLPLVRDRLVERDGYLIYIAIILSGGFFLIRILGQGSLTLLSRNMVMQWFERRRGMANAVMGTAIGSVFSLAPRFFDVQIQQRGWQGAWRLTTLILIGFALFAAIFFRDKPEDYGLKPDGKLAHNTARAKFAPAKEHTLREARASFSFWIYTLTLATNALIITAYTFHIVSIFQEVAIERATAIRTLFPAAIIALIFNFVGSWASDHISIKYLLLFMIGGLITVSSGLTLLLHSGQSELVVVVIIGLGMMQGQFGTLSAITWPRLYGRTHLGAISGLSTAVVVAGSALGPFFFSMLRDLSGSYATAAILCGAISSTLFIGALWVQRER